MNECKIVKYKDCDGVYTKEFNTREEARAWMKGFDFVKNELSADDFYCTFENEWEGSQ